MKRIIIEQISEDTDIYKLAGELAGNLHDDDCAEMMSLGVSIFPYILYTIKSSRLAYAVYSVNGKLLNVMGLSRYKDSFGVPVWSLKTKGQKEYKREFIVYGRRFIKQFLEVEPKLFNYISVNNESSLRFIKACGAEILPATQYGALNESFCPFILTKGAFEQCVETR